MSTDRRTRVEDGYEITDTFEDGVLMGSAVVPVQQAAEAAAEQARLDVLHKLLDASQPDPDVASVLRVLAFGVYADKRGVEAAQAVAGEALTIDLVEVKG